MILVVVQMIGPNESFTLGPVRAVTPDQVIPNGFVGYVFNPTISDRGQAVTVHDAEVRDNGFVFLDTGGPEPMVDGMGMAVSGNGCVALWARPSGSASNTDAVMVGVTDRCAGGERLLYRTSAFYENMNVLALDFDGRFGVVLKSNLPVGTEFPSHELVRVDTQTGAQQSMPLPSGYSDWNVSNGVDISADGSLVVVPVLGRFMDVALWNVGTNAVELLTTASLRDGSAAFPSISGDGRYVSFAASKPFVGTEVGNGPWVYVLDRAFATFRLVSGAAAASYFSSLSRDGSQVAFAVASTGCKYDGRLFGQIENDCSTTRIDVVYTSVPGFASGFATETISLDIRGGTTGLHVEPQLSGNGRWVTWVSNAYDALIGGSTQFSGQRHAFVRRRDPQLSVDPIDFGTISAGSSTVRTTTVRNSGTTSVYLDQITLDPASFARAGGTCADGGSLPPGATCTIDVRYTASGGTATTDGTILVTETGYDPVAARNTLRGASQAGPTTTSSVTTIPAPTTTLVGQNVPTTTTGEIALAATPNPVEYGGVPFQLPSPTKTITVTNTGTAAGVLVTVIGGANPEDFGVNVNECNAFSVAPGGTCIMDVVLFARSPGERSAVLTVSSGPASVDILLRGNGTFAPRLLVTPAAVTQHGYASILGHGFPPGEPMLVDVGGDVSISATPDVNGRFEIPFSPFGLLTLGNHVITVAARPLVYEEVRTQLVVVLPTFQPQGPGGPAFGSSLIVTRGS